MIYYGTVTDNRSLIASIIVILLILGIIGGAIYYLTQTFRGRVASTPKPSPIAQAADTQGIPLASFTPEVTNQPAPIVTPEPIPQAAGIYNGKDFSLTYPKNWGLLTCNNSENFEFDPSNATPQLNVPCSFAVKPVTILVNASTTCTGDRVNIGSYQVTKEKLVDVNINGNKYEAVYRWCFVAKNKNFDISHRVSKQGFPASSKDDFSNQVEQVISSIR